MPNKMLIDASHPEETRVVVVRGNRIEEFDFESQDKKQLKGNIYLARVTRVEPSLQAAFVEYGGNRHGFLAFSEIHPDYYQIPVADRQALLRAEADEAAEEDDEDGGERDRERSSRGGRKRRRGGKSRDREASSRNGASEEDASAADDAGNGDAAGDDLSPAEEFVSAEASASQTETPADVAAAADETAEAPTETAESEEAASDDGGTPPKSIAAATESDVVSEKVADPDDNHSDHADEVHSSRLEEENDEVESVGAEDALEEVRNRRKPARRHYKIQEVIKRRQILLVQVVKEERGNKGAALTTYLSLAGRYSVLMPNTARGGGISRKITNAQDRKRLKEVVSDLDVPQGMGVILRTAGESRTKAEIKRDYEYLMRLWENVRSLTLESSAPALVYEEGSLIKRSVRDLYNKDIDEILVAGDEGYREAKDFMRMLMPSHAKVVQPYRDNTPIFVRSGIEAQLDRMLQPQVTLKSGGYIIINQTEALVAIDVNSGRSTKEHSIEETALHTNLEAAEEVARQLRLRDLAGLIVIDFIDMEENRNNRAVEKRLKDHLKNDRARIQLGRISHFGLMEMSRQRIRASVLESTMKPCPTCGGTGHVRSESSVGLLVVRAIEEYLLKDSRCHITVRTPTSTALYVLNHKRSSLADLEAKFGVIITVEMDDSVGGQHYAIDRGAVAEKPADFVEAVSAPMPVEEDDIDDDIVEIEAEEAVEEARPAQQPRHGQENGEDGNRDRKRRRRRRRRGGRDRDNGAPRELDADGQPIHAENGAAEGGASDGNAADAATSDETAADGVAAESTEEAQARKRRRGKRGGKRNRRDGTEGDVQADSADAEPSDATAEPAGDAALADETGIHPDRAAEAASEPEVSAEPEAEAEEEKPKKPRRAARPRKTAAEKAAEKAEAEKAAEPAAAEAVAETAAEPVEEAAPKAVKPRPTRRKAAAKAEAPAEVVVSSSKPEEAPEAADAQPKKAGWWQRRSFF
ncbi:MAG: ribonuclease E/G [Alphaproteobacteria bacterium]|nr:ribonuclease E/G [Alphaproteobacteria bacterium]MBU0806092.1 ribonuclease E/G [Alphaproteobacteria bacterium]MBU0871250.1 ribonuclease E/G [Alphaproteobacteria bacterium]MBU1400400.1 ribonuclease E/G [Alphaproteobacteria bacterium]MBU1591617.1 ribonuclease E/G [Alphaproteobacteria bacterium]